MNIFAGNIILKWNNTIKNLDFDYIENLSKTWDKVVYLFWETELKSTDDLVLFLTNKLWNILSYDISIETENKVDIINDTYEQWVYELATFEWEQVDFNEISDRFKWFEEVVSIRESDISTKFWNKIIKVDFVY